jgi:hypothetical protein
MLELADLVTECIAVVLLQTVIERRPAGGTRVERIERPVEQQRLRFAVVGVFVREAEAAEAVQKMRIQVRGADRFAVDVLLPDELDRLAGAEQVLLLDPRAAPFSPPWRLKLIPGFSVQTSLVRTSRSTFLPSYATGVIFASYRYLFSRRIRSVSSMSRARNGSPVLNNSCLRTTYGFVWMWILLAVR